VKRILLLGAGRSASVLISKLVQNAERKNWQVDVVDVNIEQTKQKIGQSNYVRAIEATESNFTLIENYEIVISMLPPDKHYEVAKACVHFGKHLLTASYNTSEIQSLHHEAKRKNILLLMECGLDPGLDHISAMQIIDNIHAEGGVITRFKSYCGGLMSNKSDIGNPWKYKITWNPKNIVLAGQGPLIKYLENGEIKHLNYHRLFKQTHHIEIENERYEGYPNRDSLKYLDIYGLGSAKTFIRGTLRKEGFCAAWHILVHLGFTDDTTIIYNLSDTTYKSFFTSFLPFAFSHDWGKKLTSEYPYLVNEAIVEQLHWLHIFSDDKIELENATPAQVLQRLVEKYWRLNENDTDKVVMQHQIEYIANGKQLNLSSSLVVEGNNAPFTAMAATVGLPLYYVLENIVENTIYEYGVKLPLKKWLYGPVLSRLKHDGIHFTEYIKNTNP